jgi:hypothetical protein
MRSWHLAGAAAALIVLVPGPAVASTDPEPGDEFESTTVVSGLSVMVERAEKRLVAGHDTDYTIAVSNRGEQPQALRVRVTVPPWMPDVTPHDGGQVGNGFIEWPVTVAPGQVTMLRLTGAYASPDRDTPTRIAFTACALGTEDNQPIVCATDIAKLSSARSGMPWWVVVLIAVVVVAAAAGTAFFLLRRRRASTRPPAEPSDQETSPAPAT